ncbi:MAG: transglutaminase-like cysteine peptidase [Xanthobacteraceae bacterium]
MFSHAAAHRLAVLLALSVSVGGAPAAAFAQYQVNVATSEARVALSPTPAVPEPFGLDASPVIGGEVLAKWSGVVADVRAESDILTRCREAARSCPEAAQKFLAVIADGRAHEGRARIGVINRAINLAIKPTSDLAQWGVVDRWSAPLATLTTGRGDCEDYAIAKYVALMEAGVSADEVKLIIMHDLATGEDHAVVTARLEQKWIVLDNRRLTLLEDVEIAHVVPLFVLGHDGVKQFAPTAVASEAAKTPAPSSLRN